MIVKIMTDEMRNATILLMCVFIFSFSKEKPDQKEKINVLCIGNSLTYYHDMPGMLQKMLDSANLNYEIIQATQPGQSLEGHFNDMVDSIVDGSSWTHHKEPGDTTPTEKILYSKKWDHIVLQEGQVRYLIPEVRALKVVPSLLYIKQLVKANDTKLVLFKTWASIDAFPKQDCYPSTIVDRSIKKQQCCSPRFKFYYQEASYLNFAYDSVAKVTNIPTLPITDCFAFIVKNHPAINLNDDHCHPSTYGSYLNACVLFKYLTKQKASSIIYFADLDKKSAVTIQNAVDKVYQ
jgi:hypothetical protein